MDTLDFDFINAAILKNNLDLIYETIEAVDELYPLRRASLEDKRFWNSFWYEWEAANNRQAFYQAYQDMKATLKNTSMINYYFHTPNFESAVAKDQHSYCHELLAFAYNSDEITPVSKEGWRMIIQEHINNISFENKPIPMYYLITTEHIINIKTPTEPYHKCIIQQEIDINILDIRNKFCGSNYSKLNYLLDLHHSYYPVYQFDLSCKLINESNQSKYFLFVVKLNNDMLNVVFENEEVDKLSCKFQFKQGKFLKFIDTLNMYFSMFINIKLLTVDKLVDFFYDDDIKIIPLSKHWEIWRMEIFY